MFRRSLAVGVVALACSITSCHLPAVQPDVDSEPRLPAARSIGARLDRHGAEIAACGQLFHAGTPVVLFDDPGGYDAYKPHSFFTPERTGTVSNPEQVSRFGVRRNLPPDVAERVKHDGWQLDDLKQCVSQIVVHYDVAGTSWNCFKVLHDVRGLSCHFLLDVDGTIYQTLDLKERAWHAGVANDASIGIEIAHIGANQDASKLRRWYPNDEGKAYYRIPRLLRGRLPEEYVGIPSRSGLFEGQIHGKTYYQYDFTEDQYRALERLIIALVRIFPNIDLVVPTNADGDAVWEVLDEPTEFRGVVGHYHLTEAKQDPGPAFDWKRIERALQRERVIREIRGDEAAVTQGASGRSK